MVDLAGLVGLLGRGLGGAPLRLRAHPCQIGRVADQLATGAMDGVLQRVDGSAALAAVKIDPVPGMLAGERNDAGAVLARRIASDIGKPPFIAYPPAVLEMSRHPMLGGRTQPRDDFIEIKPLGWSRRFYFVEVEHRRLNRAARGRARRG